MPGNKLASVVDALAAISPFDRADDLARQRMATRGRLLVLTRGDTISRGERDFGGLCVVLNGEIKRYLLAPNGAERMLQLLGAGRCYGEDAALLGFSSPVVAQATCDTTVLQCRHADLHDTMSQSAAFATAVANNLAVMLQDVLENLQLCLQRTSMQRVAHYLVRQKTDAEDGGAIELPADKRTIAAHLDVTPETLSRVLARLVGDGIIRTCGRRGLVIDKPAELRRYAGN